MSSVTYPMNPIIERQLAEQTKKRLAIAIMMILALWLLMGSEAAHAQSMSGTMPWETFTQKLAQQLCGPWVKWLAVIAVALGGVMFGLGELSGPFKRTMEIAGGFSIAVGAPLVVATMLGNQVGLTCNQ